LNHSGDSAGVPQAADLPLSFTNLRLVPQEMLDARVETIKSLQEGENETYLLVKDVPTGEHYLHYAVRHLNLAAGGAEEEFHHLMFLEHDDVIALALGAQEFVYPEHWNKPYLRNGPYGGFVWYDPAGASEESAQFEAIAEEIRAKLQAFRREGRGGTEDVLRLMDDVDRMFRPKPSKEDPSPDQ
jgi:hypothetical protein